MTGWRNDPTLVELGSDGDLFNPCVDETVFD